MINTGDKLKDETPHFGNTVLCAGAVSKNGIQLIHGDSLQALKSYGDNHFDLAIVDPPYGIDMGNKINSVTGGVKHTAKDWDKYTPTQEYWDELFRVSKNQIVWGGNYFMSKIKRDSPCWIFWDKNNGDSLFADGDMAWTSFRTPVRIAKIHWCGSAAKHETGQNKIHPTQKPIQLYRWLLHNYTSEGDLILDTHLGSGSIAIACHQMKRKLIGYEIDADYYRKACKRFEEQTRQTALW